MRFCLYFREKQFIKHIKIQIEWEKPSTYLPIYMGTSKEEMGILEDS